MKHSVAEPASASALIIIIIVVMLTSAIDFATSTATQKCTDVQLQCMGRTGCSTAMRNYLLSCEEVMHGEVNHCPDRCRKALVSLLSSEESRTGDGFMTCDCQGDEFCVQQRRRLSACTSDVVTIMSHVFDATTPIGCSLAEAVCSADTSCLAAMDFYRLHCKKLFQVME